MEIIPVTIELPEGTNVIIGQTHFIKSIEDLYEAIINTSPHIQFGIAFNEASGVCLVRKDGNNKELMGYSENAALKIGAGHIFVVYIKEGFPINILPSIKETREVVHIFCATANPVEVVIAETKQGRGVMGVIDGFPSKGVEKEVDIKARKKFLRNTGYKL